MAISTKHRPYGSGPSDTDRLRRLYDSHTRGKRRVFKPHGIDPLLAATGDPLVEQDRDLAARVYGLAGAPRPAVRLRHIEAAVFGDALSSIADMAAWFLERWRWSALRAAAEAVVLAAERGTWIGAHAPVSFDKAVEVVRKEVGLVQRRGASRPEPGGWTGEYRCLVPAEGMRIRMPEANNEVLPAAGALVRDDAYWRRRIADGDVRPPPALEKIDQHLPGLAREE